MNKRIRELYQQAHMVREYPEDDPMRGGDPPTVYWGGGRSAERFAELIVKECIDLAITEEEKYSFSNSTPAKYFTAAISDFQGVLAKHFGVES